METAQWRKIAIAPDYEVSDRGDVRRCVADWQGKYAGRVLRPGYTRGYARVTLCVDGRKICRSVHTLVCAAFNGPRPPDKSHCAHRDDEKSNNTPSNLYWATPQENADDRCRNGKQARGPATRPKSRPEVPWQHLHPEKVLRGKDASHQAGDPRYPKGETMPCAKLTEAAVKAIREVPHYHGVGRDLARQHGVSMGLISQLRKGRGWRYLTASDKGGAPPPSS